MSKVQPGSFRDQNGYDKSLAPTPPGGAMVPVKRKQREANGHMMGRRSKLTPEAIERAVDCILAGNYKKTAFRVAGYNPDYVYDQFRVVKRLIESGEDPNEYENVKPWYDFMIAVEEAYAGAEEALVGMVVAQARSGLPNTWQAAMTLLERTRPADFGRRDTTVIEGGETHVHIGDLIADPNLRSDIRTVLRRLASPSEIEPGRTGNGHVDADAVIEGSAVEVEE